ncbi:MAG: hypothetical protein ACK552_05705 [Microcystis sp.]|jgi:hypothetical protein|nr:hypothetical protein [Microcystis aeruginosa LG13-13]NCR01465.1 hypothetical protein [Microcystis aeruginosa L211-11]NCR06538.1 hypothetical protein [Microcystis aeruginosa LG13-03]NCR33099.1 hypothetical protein [Microcystis aeruginosa L211-101]NCR64747.1 hypothetical protein [Microcystis aeruginosa LG11-05]NCR73259.1 hypothetical protein [Microcystis aeruginosa LG13-12]
MSNHNDMHKLIATIGVELGKLSVEVAKDLRTEHWMAHLQELYDRGTFNHLATGVFEEFQNKGYMQKLAEELENGDNVQQGLEILKKVLEQASKFL